MATYYVYAIDSWKKEKDKKGVKKPSDKNPGTIEKPFATIDKAVQKCNIKDGDDVIFFS
jgi:hypothetical protein